MPPVILLVGSGGREHAIADAIRREDPRATLIAAPGNPGIAECARCVPIPVSATNDLVALAEAETATLVIVGPEAPLADGLVDQLRRRGIAAFGPTQAAAAIETSKHFAKDIMLKAGVPTARSETHRTVATAHAAVRERFGAPVVIKASGLAAGKGVAVCHTLDDAHAAIDRIMSDKAYGAAGDECLVEAFMTGEELSLFALTDGTDVLTMVPAQDHKRLLNGDEGPNTGGMGAYAPVSIGTPALVDDVTERILLPTLHGMRKAGTPFTGLLYAGLMLTEEGPQVVEFNCRFGDPETQVVLPLLTSSLLDPMMAIARGDRIGSLPSLIFASHAAVTTVVAAHGYPESVRNGNAIELPESTDTLRVYHAGTRRREDGVLVTAGGRVVSVTGVGATFHDAQRASQAGADAVAFEGRQMRTDIGWREAARRR